MANWCANRLEVAHDDLEALEGLIAGANAGQLLDFLRPMPGGLDGASLESDRGTDGVEAMFRIATGMMSLTHWYGWRRHHWGTSWEAREIAFRDDEGAFVRPKDGDEAILGQRPDGRWYANLTFETAWDPPVEAYRGAEARGFHVSATYFEEGNGFVGTYVDGTENLFEFPDPSNAGAVASWLDTVPARLDAEYDLRQILTGTAATG